MALAALVLSALASSPVASPAQTTVIGRVVDGDGAAVSLANVQLQVHADSAPARATISDAQGNFLLQDVSPGAYRIRVSRIGYRTLISDALTVADGQQLRLPPLVLHPEAIELQGLTVQAMKALYQQRADRLVINIGSSLTLASASALQVLERSPGVVVDRVSGSISLIGKSGVRLLVNGKASYIPPDGLLQYLAGLSAENIERIELITSPPASLDAEGNAGYVNIVLKRNPEAGLSGSVSGSAGYGSGEIGNAGADVSYRGGRIHLYGSYAFLWNGQEQFISNFRRIADAGATTEMPAESFRDPVQRNHAARLVLEYRLDDRTTLGALFAAYDNRWSMDALNRLTITKDGAPTTRVESDNEEVNHWRHGMGNVSLERDLGAGGTLRMDLDYLRYDNDNPTVYLNASTDVASGETTREQVESGKLTPLGILVAKADYRSSAEPWVLEAGVKGAFSRFTNETSLRGGFDEDWIAAAGFGSRSTLREDVVAVYGSAAYTPREGTTLSAGLRYELTDSNLGSEEQPDIVDRRFGDFFPSISLSHKLSEELQVDASYTRRTTRPSFSDMAPFLYFFDPHTFFSGNAALQPATINTLKLDGTYASWLMSLQYAWEHGTIAAFQNRFLPEHDVHVIFPVNFRGTKTATALLAAPVALASWWTTQNNGTVLWQEVDGVQNDARVLLSATSYRLNSTHTISLPANLSFESSGFYQSASLFGATRFGALWQVNAAVQVRLPRDAKLTLRADNLFDSSAWHWTTGSPADPLFIDTLLDFAPPAISLAYSARFGGGQVTPRRASASEEERGRVQ